jgi:hypothetical protein
MQKYHDQLLVIHKSKLKCERHVQQGEVRHV